MEDNFSSKWHERNIFIKHKRIISPGQKLQITVVAYLH